MVYDLGVITWPAVEREIIRRRGYAEFVRRAWHTCESQPLHWHRAAGEIAQHLEAQYRGDLLSLVINVPPGSTKSTLASVMLAPWIWTFNPEWRLMFASYNQAAANALAEKSLRVLQSDWYRERWGDILDPERIATSNIRTRAGGCRFATSVGGTATSMHFHWASIDDPIKAETAGGLAKQSALLERARTWLRETLPTRSVDASAFRRTLTMQRLHEADPTAVALEDGWTSLCLPALYEPERRCVTPFGGDWRTEPGEPLEPERRPRAVLDATAASMGGWEGMVVNAQLQQRPAPPGGAIFKRDTFQTFRATDIPFRTTLSVLSIDCAFKGASSSDSVALEVWGARDAKFYLYHSWCERTGFLGTLRQIQEVLREYPCNAVLIEAKANGSAVIEMLEQANLPGVLDSDPQTSKIARAQVANVHYAAGRVHHLEGAAWVNRKQHNLAVFPNGAHDDDVDATTQALIWLAGQCMGAFHNVPASAWEDFAQLCATHLGRR
jgi:predicted phage terminase large subunit-like protein